MKRLPIASACLLIVVLGCAARPEKAQMKEAIDELRMMRQELAKMGSTDSAEYEIRVALMAFYSYLLEKEAQVPYHIPTVEVVGDTERVRRYSYWTPDTYIRDVHYNGDRFDYIEIKDLKIMAYDTDARASYKIIPYRRVSRKGEEAEESTLVPILVNEEPFALFPPASPVRLKRLPDESGKEMMWKVNYKDALIAGFQVPKSDKPGLWDKFARLFVKEDKDPEQEFLDENKKK